MAPSNTLQFPFYPGLLYSCLLNAVVYGLNDYADVHVDVSNDRKGNVLFGPRLSRPRLRKLVETGIVCTFLPLVIWAYTKQQLFQYLMWYGLVLLVNVAYNFPTLGHCSQNGPFEIPVVYFGFSLVTVLSYWLNGERSGDDDNVFGYQVSNNNTSIKLFGCNLRYWIHLWFLVCRTQLWTEYMDYESDRAHERGTTLAKLPTKSVARIVVLSVLLSEAAWNWQQFCQVQEWKALCAFSLLGLVSFVGMEMAPLKTSTFVWVALVQSMGGLWLIQECWNKRVFVS